MKKLLLYTLLLCSQSQILAQSHTKNYELEGKLHIEWTSPLIFSDFDETEVHLLNFSNAIFSYPSELLPSLSLTVYLPLGTDSSSIEIFNFQTSPVTIEEQRLIDKSKIPNQAQASVVTSWDQGKPIGILKITPIYKDPNTNEILKIHSLNYKITPHADNISRASNWNFKANSVLRHGNWVKVGVVTDGIYKVSYTDMNEMGFDVSNLLSNNIRVFGNGGGYLPFNNSQFRLDDLEENAIEIQDGGDGQFNPGDFILFYGQDPNRWIYKNARFEHLSHLYSDTTYYFITTDYAIGKPKRVSPRVVSGTPDLNLNTFNAHLFHEVDLINFIKSGRNWYGESFNFTKTQSFTFSVPNVMGNTAKIKSRMAFRVINRPSSFTFSVNGTDIQKISHNGVDGYYYHEYAGVVSKVDNFTIPSPDFTVDVHFSNPSSADNAWMDYIEITCDRQLSMIGNQMPFRHSQSLTANLVKYNMTNINNTRVWNVTQATHPIEMSLKNGSFQEFGGEINEFIAFKNSGYLSVMNFGKVANQNLHAVQSADYVIVTHPDFLQQANQLAEFHRNHSQLNTVVVTTQQLYNEFSSGSRDLTAIKSFNKMLYDRAGTDPNKMLKYVLLLGDASYDSKNRYPGNTNYIPAYQSFESLLPTGTTSSYVSDDYIGFLDDYESDALSSTLDIGVGRIMAHSVTQAQDIINKTINYMSNPETMRPWRNRISFIGDDEDGVKHMSDSDKLATKIDSAYPNYNLNKIYLDAFQQISNAGGSTYPEVNTAIDQTTETGSLIINYIGHGGEIGWAHERILGIPQIKGYKNFNRLALYVTATCEFSRFDDPDRTSAGEFTLLNPQGGALALLTTTRLVFSKLNFALTSKFYNHVFEKIDGKNPRLGDLLRLSKVGGNNINTRNFILLGDPAAQLAYPKYQVRTTVISDTIKSLQKITISGYVSDEMEQKITQFDGTIYPIIYGQHRTQSTLNNDGNGVMQFETQQNALFNGKASVRNGEFEFSFIVPKDIHFNYGNGKISYYAENGVTDAAGAFEDFIIGGLDGDPEADKIGPDVQLWLNDESFVIGGLTDQNPMLFAKVFDESGINTVGNGIGHDIVAVIDENTSSSITLNDYYEAELDSYQRGSISYNFSNLPEGKHTLRLKVWDVYNNSSEAFTEFYVSHSSGFQIAHVLNYPNPFTNNTDFYFDHNAIGQRLEVRVQIYTISGKLVKTIDHTEQSESFRSQPIHWDGRDQYGDRIGKGTYIYKMKVTNSFDETVETFETIVML